MLDNVITPDATVEPYPFASFRRDETLWPRHGLHRARVREMAALYKAGGMSALPPIVIATVARLLFLVDGWHRSAAAEQVGLLRLNAVVRPLDQLGDVYLEAVAASATTDQPLTREEKRAVVDRLLVTEPSFSDRGIARIAGVCQPFVSGSRKRLQTPAGERDTTRGRSLTAAERTADQLLNALRELNRLQGSLRHYRHGRAIDPVGLIAEAAARRGGDPELSLATLERWVSQARLRVAGKAEPDSVNC